jgi:hypothetical protein
MQEYVDMTSVLRDACRGECSSSRSDIRND